MPREDEDEGERMEQLYMAVSTLGHLRTAVYVLGEIAHPVIPQDEIQRWRRDVQRAALLLEAEVRYHFGGDNNEPGERSHIPDRGIPELGPVALCRDVVETEQGGMAWARKPDVVACPACLRAHWVIQDRLDEIPF